MALNNSIYHNFLGLGSESIFGLEIFWFESFVFVI